MTEAITHLDYETYSEDDLKGNGLYHYAEHPSTDFTAVTFAGSSGDAHFWMPWAPGPKTEFIKESILAKVKLASFHVGLEPPPLLRKLLDDPNMRFGAHNAGFERIITKGAAGKRHGLPEIAIERWKCTMAKAAVHGLPHGLEGAADAIGSYPKRKEGVNEMRYFSKPRKDGSRPTPDEEPDRYIQMALYNIDDVYAERDLDHKVPDLTDKELQVYFLDQRMNDKGILIDPRAIADMQFLIDEYKAQLAEFCKRVTGLGPTQTGKLSEWIRANGFPQLTDLQAPTVVEAIANPDCPDTVKQVLRCYSTYAMKAVSKYESMPRAACRDGRLRGLFKFYGAGPGRWSSTLVGLQNFMRPLINDPDTMIALARQRNLESIRMMYDVDPMKAIASCVRGMLISDFEKDLVSSDFSQIEAVIRCWLAGDEGILEVFRRGQKIYKFQGARMFGVPPEKVVDEGASQLYTAAKIGDLACGFQGHEAAVEKFARQMGVKLVMPAMEIANRWRDANPLVVRLWRDLEDAARMAVEKKASGQAFAIPNKRIMFKVEGRWLYMRLPSGRKLAYLDPEIHDDQVTYMGVDTYTRRWMRVHTYGGRLLQNATEGIGRDFLVAGVQNAEAAGYTPVMLVHDQCVAEIDEDFGSLEAFNALMIRELPWAKGLPVRADGWRARRFRK